MIARLCSRRFEVSRKNSANKFFKRTYSLNGVDKFFEVPIRSTVNKRKERSSSWLRSIVRSSDNSLQSSQIWIRCDVESLTFGKIFFRNSMNFLAKSENFFLSLKEKGKMFDKQKKRIFPVFFFLTNFGKTNKLSGKNWRCHRYWENPSFVRRAEWNPERRIRIEKVSFFCEGKENRRDLMRQRLIFVKFDRFVQGVLSLIELLQFLSARADHNPSSVTSFIFLNDVLNRWIEKRRTFFFKIFLL